MVVKAVRGAIQVSANSAEMIEKGVTSVVPALLDQNGITEDRIVSLVFSQTDDLNAANPAASLRKIGFNDVPLFCTREPDYPGSLPRMLRVLLTVSLGRERVLKPVYMGGAERLRPDLF